MVLFLVLLYASLVLSYENGIKCIRDCSTEFDVSCAFDGQCYFEAESPCLLEIEICLRKEYRKHRFIQTKDGYCIESNYPKRARPCIPMKSSVKLPFGKDYGPEIFSHHRYKRPYE